MTNAFTSLRLSEHALSLCRCVSRSRIEHARYASRELAHAHLLRMRHPFHELFAGEPPASSIFWIFHNSLFVPFLAFSDVLSFSCSKRLADILNMRLGGGLYLTSPWRNSLQCTQESERSSSLMECSQLRELTSITLQMTDNCFLFEDMVWNREWPRLGPAEPMREV